MEMKTKTKSIIVRIIVILAGYALIDYINLPSVIGFLPANINLNIFGILFDAAIVLVLYTISFYYIDNRQNEKDANAKDIANILINKSYQECLDNLKLLDNRQMIKEYIIPKVDGNKPASENKVINNMQELPFASLEAIIGFAANGYVEKEKMDNYLDIKKEYQYLVNVKITFFDLIEGKTYEQRAMYNDIQSRDYALKIRLKNCIAKRE